MAGWIIAAVVLAAVALTVEERSGGGPDGCHRREPVERGDVHEDLLHPVARALRVPRAQEPRKTVGLRTRMPGAHEAASDLGGRALARLGVEGIAAEEIDLLGLREETGTRVAARDALHLVDGQEFLRLGPIREELVAAVVVARDDQHVAADVLATRGCVLRYARACTLSAVMARSTHGDMSTAAAFDASLQRARTSRANS